MLRAVAEAVQEDPGNLSLQGVAARADVGVATAYRYFPSPDELLEAYTIAPPENSSTSPRSDRAGTFGGALHEHARFAVDARS